MKGCRCDHTFRISRLFELLFTFLDVLSAKQTGKCRLLKNNNDNNNRIIIIIIMYATIYIHLILSWKNDLKHFYYRCCSSYWTDRSTSRNWSWLKSYCCDKKSIAIKTNREESHTVVVNLGPILMTCVVLCRDPAGVENSTRIAGPPLQLSFACAHVFGSCHTKFWLASGLIPGPLSVVRRTHPYNPQARSIHRPSSSLDDDCDLRLHPQLPLSSDSFFFSKLKSLPTKKTHGNKRELSQTTKLYNKTYF